MELRQLEYLVAVAEEANFTRAAERVHVSQSGVSAQIRQLEREVGAELFDRSSRVVVPTPAGKAALAHARAALGAVRELTAAVDDVTGAVRGELAVGMVTACTVTGLFDALARFHAAHPGIELTVSEDHSSVLVDGVRDGALDVALVGVPGEVPADLEGGVLVDEPIALAVPSAHPLAGAESVALADALAYPLVTMPPGTGVRDTFELECAAHGLTPTVACQASAPDAVADLCGRGLGVAVLSESMVAAYPLVRVRVADAAHRALLALVWRPGAGLAVRRLVDECCTAFPTLRLSAA
ncbi:LysR family transcriptional regulator [Rhodococcus sp. HNM0569]|uniref:LysR family transcriptional regulator n=1 Tax=Rhodococcus sp. HNM0569 TaxID=2716340 RepID=UPI00146E88F5|nr:LysR family transcriptional regulator [Rhodococcus sp. HNM0569]NLU83856.1 LysR family transcriptional regulator [Rhodococcus sp. HNM0569]